jgi:hypothetical protein
MKDIKLIIKKRLEFFKGTKKRLEFFNGTNGMARMEKQGKATS